jgi:hypothetical protein
LTFAIKNEGKSKALYCYLQWTKLQGLIDIKAETVSAVENLEQKKSHPWVAFV